MSALELALRSADVKTQVTQVIITIAIVGVAVVLPPLFLEVTWHLIRRKP